MFIALKRILPNLKMQPDGRNPHWPALLIVSRIRDMLKIEARKKARE